MAKTSQYQCQNCGDGFTARTADRARGWARFCSKSCKAVRQERTTGQNQAYQRRRQAAEEGYSDADLDFDGGWDEHKAWRF